MKRLYALDWLWWLVILFLLLGGGLNSVLSLLGLGGE